MPGSDDNITYKKHGHRRRAHRPEEEEYLERKFGAAYVDHKSRVRRWL